MGSENLDYDIDDHSDYWISSILCSSIETCVFLTATPVSVVKSEGLFLPFAAGNHCLTSSFLISFPVEGSATLGQASLREKDLV
jgi:hypothetical protein